MEYLIRWALILLILKKYENNNLIKRNYNITGVDKMFF
jgi:hypothetical protein